MDYGLRIFGFNVVDELDMAIGVSSDGYCDAPLFTSSYVNDEDFEEVTARGVIRTLVFLKDDVRTNDTKYNSNTGWNLAN